MIKKKLLAVGLAMVLGIATAFVAVVLSAKSLHWFNSLTAGEQKAFTYPLVLLTVIASALSGWRMWRRARNKRTD